MKYPKPSPNWNIASNLYCTPSFAITTVRSCRMECRWHKEPEGKDPTCFFYHDRLRTQRSGFLLRNFQKPETQRSIYWWEHEIYWQIKFLSCIARQLAHQVLQKKGNALFKIFDGEYSNEFYQYVKKKFVKVKLKKPKVSRKQSSELYCICLGYTS